MGANKFQVTLESGAMGPPMMFTNKQAQEVVSTYRTTYPGIPEFWSRTSNMLLWTLDRYNTTRLLGIAYFQYMKMQSNYRMV